LRSKNSKKQSKMSLEKRGSRREGLAVVHLVARKKGTTDELAVATTETAETGLLRREVTLLGERKTLPAMMVEGGGARTILIKRSSLIKVAKSSRSLHLMTDLQKMKDQKRLKGDRMREIGIEIEREEERLIEKLTVRRTVREIVLRERKELLLETKEIVAVAKSEREATLVNGIERLRRRRGDTIKRIGKTKDLISKIKPLKMTGDQEMPKIKTEIVKMIRIETKGMIKARINAQNLRISELF
jgi:hypothetical protein